MDYQKDRGLKWLQTFDLQPMFAQEKYNIGMESGMLEKQRFTLWNLGWDHVNIDSTMKCHLYQMLFRQKGFIPTYCMDCWKVVVKPRTLRELYALRDMQRYMAETDPFCYSKCGIEERPYVPGLYGGYFYTRSEEDGETRYRQVRTLANQMIHIDVPVILKRYCTEFEIKLGDSAKYEQPENAKDIEELFYSLLDPYQPNPVQRSAYKHHVYHKWQVFGWKFGTPEDRKQIEEDWNDGGSYYPLPRTYEKGE